MALHTVRFVDDPIAHAPKEIRLEFARSFDDAMDRALAAIGKLRRTHGSTTGYIIEDITGRRVMIGPGRDFDEQVDL